jgi:osmotically inducible protein OsmC
MWRYYADPRARSDKLFRRQHARSRRWPSRRKPPFIGRPRQAGQGQISTETGALSSYPYGFASRFEGDKRGTNPEEILGAAHAACFAMAFSFTCDKAGFETKVVDAKAAVRLVQQGDGFLIDRIALTLDAQIPGIDDAKFQELAQSAKQFCPLSKALASVPEITLTATLRP